jgi:hypothetical protein
MRGKETPIVGLDDGAFIEEEEEGFGGKGRKRALTVTVLVEVEDERRGEEQVGRCSSFCIASSSYSYYCFWNCNVTASLIVMLMLCSFLLNLKKWKRKGFWFLLFYSMPCLAALFSILEWIYTNYSTD